VATKKRHYVNHQKKTIGFTTKGKLLVAMFCCLGRFEVDTENLGAVGFWSGNPSHVTLPKAQKPTTLSMPGDSSQIPTLWTIYGWSSGLIKDAVYSLKVCFIL